LSDVQAKTEDASERAQRLQSAREALDQGDLFRACDLASAGALPGPDVDFAHIHVLAMAHMGQLAEARRLYEDYGLNQVQTLEAQTLGARLLKDAALAERPAKPEDLHGAAEAYLAAYTAFGDPYPGINAASLFLMSGQSAIAGKLAHEILAIEKSAASYYDSAIRAEALLILRRIPAAQAELEAAARLTDVRPAARATTRRQLGQLANTLNLSADMTARLLAPIAPRVIATYCGHMFEADAVAEQALLAKVDEVLDRAEVGIAYGSLARGADIVIAERVLARGCELNVVLPFEAEDFIRASVGDAWRPRFEACMAAARTVTLATTTTFVQDPHQFRFGSDVAMGLASLRAEFLGAQTVQIAVWDGSPPEGIAGTATNVKEWERFGGRPIVIAPTSPRIAQRDHVAAPGDRHTERSIKAIIFADFVGFSRLREDRLPAFWTEVMDRIATVIARNSAAIAYRNTWGDALFAVIHSAGDAAEVALELLEQLAMVDRTALGMDDAAGLRIGAHLGPIYSGEDSVCGGINFFGTEVNRAARIEPVTPPGAVYVTESFAATLALQEPGRFTCAYMGQVELPKSFGRQRMYRLSRNA
jgi:class 3 adenylate cyclase